MTDLITRLSNALRQSGKKLATAESCTGGLISARITDLSGSSSIFDRGFVTYSNDAKEDMLSVDSIGEFGAVSEQTALQMAQGALDYSLADIGASCTGIAGPDGGSAEKPVGLVYIAIATEEDSACFKHNFKGDRASIREQTVQAVLQHVLDLF